MKKTSPTHTVFIVMPEVAAAKVQAGALKQVIEHMLDYTATVSAERALCRRDAPCVYLVSSALREEVSIGKDVPVLWLHESSQAHDGAGAASLTAPLRYTQLCATIEQLMQACSTEGHQLLGEGLFYHAAKRQLSCGEQVRDITEAEGALIHYLLQHRGQVIALEVLKQQVFAYAEDTTTHTVETHMYRLRQKIKELVGEKDIILTEPEGYLLP